MVEYLKKYKKLLELKEINEKEIQENKLLIDDNLQKWLDEIVKESNIDSEIKTLNKKYNEIIEEKKKKLRDKLSLILFMTFIISIIVLSALNPIVIALVPLIALATGGMVYLTPIIIETCTPIFRKKIEKDEIIIELLEQIKIKENKLSNTKKLLNHYSTEIIKYRSISTKLQEKNNWIDDSIKELMRNYAEPIFEAQLKFYQEETEVKDNKQPKTKSRKQ